MGDSSQPGGGGSTEAPGWRCDATIGRYRLLRKLAVGGMAELHLAVVEGPRGFAKQVVLKRVRRELAHRPELRAMLRDEARLAARMQHRGLVDVLELDEAAGEPFYVMRYVPGADLRAVMAALRKREQPVSLGLAVHVASEAATALHHAHELRDAQGRALGVVHRDVSSANLRLGRGGEVVVLDFGVARSHEQTARTQVGATKGNAAYMSPEQCRGGALDRRTDVFALGIVLHELITGRRLFASRDPLVCMRRILRGEVVPPSAIRPEVPALEAVVMRALRRSPDERFPSAAAMADALDHVAREQGWCEGASDVARLLETLFPSPVPSGTSVGEADLTSAMTRRHASATRNGSSAAGDEEPWPGEHERTQALPRRGEQSEARSRAPRRGRVPTRDAGSVP